jgi:hypothetical protein
MYKIYHIVHKYKLNCYSLYTSLNALIFLEAYLLNFSKYLIYYVIFNCLIENVECIHNYAKNN